jgi:hypothetical protein
MRGDGDQGPVSDALLNPIRSFGIDYIDNRSDATSPQTASRASLERRCFDLGDSIVSFKTIMITFR